VATASQARVSSQGGCVNRRCIRQPEPRMRLAVRGVYKGELRTHSA